MKCIKTDNAPITDYILHEVLSILMQNIYIYKFWFEFRIEPNAKQLSLQKLVLRL